jgi:excisionase family DNA binding protein
MRLLTVTEVSKITGLKEGTVRRWILQRRLPTVHLGRSVRIREKDLEAIIEGGYQPAVPSGGSK